MKREAVFFSFQQYFVTYCRISILKTRTSFSLRIKRLFGISEVEITRVDYIFKLANALCGAFVCCRHSFSIGICERKCDTGDNQNEEFLTSFVIVNSLQI